MARRAGSKVGAVVKRGAGGRFMGSVSVGGASFGTSGGRVKMVGSGMSLGQLRHEMSRHVAASNPLGLAKAHLVSPSPAGSALRRIKGAGQFGTQAGSIAISTAVGHRAAQRAYRKAAGPDERARRVQEARKRIKRTVATIGGQHVIVVSA